MWLSSFITMLRGQRDDFSMLLFLVYDSACRGCQKMLLYYQIIQQYKHLCVYVLARRHWSFVVPGDLSDPAILSPTGELIQMPTNRVAWRCFWVMFSFIIKSYHITSCDAQSSLICFVFMGVQLPLSRKFSQMGLACELQHVKDFDLASISHKVDIEPDPPKSFDAETVAILPAPRKVQGDWHEPLESGQHKKTCHAVRFGVRVLFVNLKSGPIY